LKEKWGIGLMYSLSPTVNVNTLNTSKFTSKKKIPVRLQPMARDEEVTPVDYA
jgi:hypothetical protein